MRKEPAYHKTVLVYRIVEKGMSRLLNTKTRQETDTQEAKATFPRYSIWGGDVPRL